MTPEVRAAYDVWKMERPARELRDKAEQARLERRKEADDTRESRLSEIRTLFRPVVTDSNEVNIALVVMCDSKSVDCDLVTGKLISGLQSAAPKMVFLQKYYTSDFINKGYFENAYQGDSIVVSEIAGLSPIDYMLLCKVKIVTTPSPSIQGLFTCRIDLAFLLLDQDGRQVNRGSFEALGPGFSAESAVDRGMANANAATFAPVFKRGYQQSPLKMTIFALKNWENRVKAALINRSAKDLELLRDDHGTFGPLYVQPNWEDARSF